MAKRISKERFNIYTIGTRDWRVITLVEEVAWFANSDETILGAVCFDFQDEDFHWIVLARDEVGQFRWVNGGASLTTIEAATEVLEEKIQESTKESIDSGFGHQGDVSKAKFDLIEIDPKSDKTKLHPSFVRLQKESLFAPARQVFSEISKWLASKDPHLKQEFQCYQFDQRIWEIYVWAVLKESGYNVTQFEAPDFRCDGFGLSMAIEATTVGPSFEGPLANVVPPTTGEELSQYLNDYLPLKFSSTLFTKLNKKHKGSSYWELEEVKGIPFVIALADFHSDNSMTYSHGALTPCLYGKRPFLATDAGKAVTKYEEIAEFNFLDKKIPAGFFKQPNSENISAVMFSNAGTLPKFNRMGVRAGFATNLYSMRRSGIKYNLDERSASGTKFDVDVLSSEYSENWADEIIIFHNPNAKCPLDERFFPNAVHIMEIDGRILSANSDGKIISSITYSVVKKDV